MPPEVVNRIEPDRLEIRCSACHAPNTVEVGELPDVSWKRRRCVACSKPLFVWIEEDPGEEPKRRLTVIR